MSFHYSLGQLRALCDSMSHVAANLNDDWCESMTDKHPWTDAQVEIIRKADERLHAMLEEFRRLLGEGHGLQ